MSFQIVLREGVTRGGFTDPALKTCIEIESDESSAKIKQSLLNPNSKNDHQSAEASILHEDLSDFARRLAGELQELPFDEPGVHEDIYGLDTSLCFRFDDYMWATGPEGFFPTESPSNRVTQEQKDKFKELVDQIKNVSQEKVSASSN